MTRRISWPIIVSLVLVIAACGDADDSTTGASMSDPAATSATTTVTTTAALTTTPTDESVVWPTDGWPVATPESQGMDSEALAGLVERLTLAGGVDSLTVIRNGYVVADAVFYPFPADAGHNIYSVTKSFIGTLIGIAIDRGLLAGVDVPVVEILADAAPDEVETRKVSMTVEHLLTMSQGFECRDDAAFDYQGLVALYESDDWTAHVLSLPMAEEPGVRFEYCNQASFLLSAILTEVTGLPASEFAAEALFEPLGMGDYVWPSSPDGITVGFSELVLQPQDMAKLGYLYLHDGRWDGEQIVSLEWVDAATRAQIEPGVAGFDPRLAGYAYGYQWWISPPHEYTMALGHGGQYIVADPVHEVLVVTTASDAPFTPEGVTNELVLSAVLSDAALAPNPEGEARLAAAVERAEAGPEPKAIELPEVATTISGVEYRLQPNDLGLDSFILEFRDQAAVLELSDGLEHVRFDVGLDGRFAVTKGEVPTAMRGRWQGETTFVITSQTVGMADPATLQLRFVDDSVHVWVSTPEASEALTGERVG